MRAVRVLPPEPAKGVADLLGHPSLAQQHAPIRAQNTDVEALASHRSEMAHD